MVSVSGHWATLASLPRAGGRGKTSVASAFARSSRRDMLNLSLSGQDPNRTTGRRGSLGLDPSRLNDRPPFLDLGLLERAERLGRLLVTGEDFFAQVSEPCTHARVGERVHDPPH